MYRKYWSVVLVYLCGCIFWITGFCAGSRRNKGCILGHTGGCCLGGREGGCWCVLCKTGIQYLGRVCTSNQLRSAVHSWWQVWSRDRPLLHRGDLETFRFLRPATDTCIINNFMFITSLIVMIVIGFVIICMLHRNITYKYKIYQHTNIMIVVS